MTTAWIWLATMLARLLSTRVPMNRAAASTTAAAGFALTAVDAGSGSGSGFGAGGTGGAAGAAWRCAARCAALAAGAAAPSKAASGIGFSLRLEKRMPM